MKKTIISLLLAITLILSTSVSVFAVNDKVPHNIVRGAVAQVMPQ